MLLFRTTNFQFVSVSLSFKQKSVFRVNSFQYDFSAKNLSVVSCQLRGEALGIVSRLSFTSL